jgi:NADPH-dependent curcumin reductase CurA
MATSNNAVILLKGQTYGDIKEGETLKFEKRPYTFGQLKEGEFVVKALYLSIDPYLVCPCRRRCTAHGTD